MKYIFLFLLLGTMFAAAQPKKISYPTPEYSNEIYSFNRDSGQLSRLEKGTASMKMNNHFGGFGGSSNGYSIEGKTSPVRMKKSEQLYFIFFGGENNSLTPEADSAIHMSGMDPALMNNSPGMGTSSSYMMDPSQTTSLYSLQTGKDMRLLTLQSFSGMKVFGKGQKQSTKYTISFKKIKEGYFELMVDKPLPKGEYAFLIMGMGMTSIDGSVIVFAFGID